MYSDQHFYDLLVYWLHNHYVYSSQTVFVVAKPEPDCWWIEYLAGDMMEALNHLPYWLPQIAFNRRHHPKIYWTAHLVKKLLRKPICDVKGSHAAVENGLADPLLRRRQEQPEANQAPGPACTIDRC